MGGRCVGVGEGKWGVSKNECSKWVLGHLCKGACGGILRDGGPADDHHVRHLGHDLVGEYGWGSGAG